MTFCHFRMLCLLQFHLYSCIIQLQKILEHNFGICQWLNKLIKTCPYTIFFLFVLFFFFFYFSYSIIMESVILIIFWLIIVWNSIINQFSCRTFLGALINLLLSLVFGVPIEVTVQQQHSSRPIPHILVKCADYLILSGNS